LTIGLVKLQYRYMWTFEIEVGHAP